MMKRSWITCHQQAFKQSLVFLLRERWSTLMTVMVIAMSLMLSSLFWIFITNVSRLTVDWQRSGSISLYLDSAVSSADEANLLARVRATPGVGEAHVTTPAEGLATLQMQEGMDDIMHYLPENPLPTAIDVIPAPTINTAAAIQQLYHTIKSYPHVDQAKVDIEWMNRFFAFLGFITKLAHGLIVILVMAVVLIVGNTLRLIIHDRHDEIMVLTWVGAGDAFIMRPFLYSGSLYGLFAALLAIVCVDVLMLSLTVGVNQFAALYHLNYTLTGLSVSQMSGLMLVSIGLGWLGARFSLKRYLRDQSPLSL